jgi:hypothetical protein
MRRLHVALTAWAHRLLLPLVCAALIALDVALMCGVRP